MVQSQPDAHCASLGPDGGDCGKPCQGRPQICPNDCVAAQAYAEATVEYPFVPSLFAPNVSVPSTAGLSDKTFEEIMKINMAIVYPTTVAFVCSLPHSSFLIDQNAISLVSYTNLHLYAHSLYLCKLRRVCATSLLESVCATVFRESEECSHL